MVRQCDADDLGRNEPPFGGGGASPGGRMGLCFVLFASELLYNLDYSGIPSIINPEK